MKRSIIISVSLIVIFLLAACSSSTDTPTVAVLTEATGQLPTTQVTTGYPAPQQGIPSDSAYPYPVASTPIPVNPIPTYTADPLMGSVIGKLLVNNNGVKDVTLYLAGVIKDKSGRDMVAGMDRSKSPITETDSQGMFAFINVEEGKYALILDVVTNQYMINYPDENTPIIVEVVPGKQVDLGDLNYDSLPLP